MRKIILILTLITACLLSQTDEEKKQWSKYDFVPCEKIIFEDNLINEKFNEFPSKWNLVYGSAEVGKFGDENVISFMTSFTTIEPNMSSGTNLPSNFTLEFDIYFYNKGNEAYTVKFGKTGDLEIRLVRVSIGKFSGEPEGKSKEAGWHHIAIAVNELSMKVYMDQYRMINIPNLSSQPQSFSIKALSHGSKKGEPSYLKNIRLAEGSFDLYDRIMTDGSFTTRGILFDAGKSYIKPESMGVINEIAELMNSHPDLKFSVEGHTDSDGDEDSNQKLSEQRAASVVNELVSMGIDKNRLKATGWGESKPVDSNDNAEGKANNRRVEFKKM